MRLEHEVGQGPLACVYDLREDSVLPATADIIAIKHTSISRLLSWRSLVDNRWVDLQAQRSRGLYSLDTRHTSDVWAQFHLTTAKLL